MKIKLTTVILSIFATLSGLSQNNFIDDLNLAGQSSLDCRAAAKVSGLALRTLGIDYFVQQNSNPNTANFTTLISQQNIVMQQSAEDIIESAEDAFTYNQNLDIDDVLIWAEMIESLNEEILDASELFVEHIENGDQQLALTIGQGIRVDVLDMIGVCNAIIDELKVLKLIPQTYDVRIVLEDSFGNLITGNTGLQGYFAYDIEHDEYFYAGEFQSQEIDLFVDLPEGTYTFGAFDGYFDGASSNTVTLTGDLQLNENDELEVTLIYWSE